MKTVSARQANHEFSDLLSRVERGEEILITKRNKPVAVLSPYRPPLMTLNAKRRYGAPSMLWGRGYPGAMRREDSGVKKCKSVMISFDTGDNPAPPPLRSVDWHRRAQSGGSVAGGVELEGGICYLLQPFATCASLRAPRCTGPDTP